MKNRDKRRKKKRDFLKDYLKMNRVKKIKIKGVEIENPTDEQVSQVMSLLTDGKLAKS